jgi:prepilin-type N-terminal cleavage/methylation domain-containing protein
MFVSRPVYGLVRSDDGFTLVELLIAIVVMGLISLSMANAFISFLSNTDTTTRRLYESHDAQLTAAYFAQDVESVGDRAISTDALLQSVERSDTTQFTACAVAGDPIPVVGFAWDDPVSATEATLVRVVYVIRTVGTERQLHRLVCLGTATTPSKDLVLAHNLSPTAPVVTCAKPSTPPAAPVVTSCSGTGSLVPVLVSMVLSIKNPANPGPALTITLTGQRAQT